MTARSVSSQPFLGGSTTITSALSSGWDPCQSGSTSSALPSKKTALAMPFRAAFSRAFSTAAGTISTPYTCAARLARKREIVPVPQYKSHTVSRPVSPASSSAFP